MHVCKGGSKLVFTSVAIATSATTRRISLCLKFNGHLDSVSSFGALVSHLVSFKQKIMLPAESTSDPVPINGHPMTFEPTEYSDRPAMKKEWSIKASPQAVNTVNPIRRTVEGLKLTPNKEKQFIPLSIGDPTLFGDFKPCTEIIDAMSEVIRSFKFNGYQPASGQEAAKQAVADYCAAFGMNACAKDVILASGCSHSLDIALTVLAKPGCNMLAPRPGFPLYKTLSALIGIEIRYYNLLPERNWEIDLEQLESQIDHNTTAIIFNNPSNPCGSVFCPQHIQQLLSVAEEHRVPIIADEIYEDIVFPGHRFHPIATLTDEVPILHCSGTTKKFLIPGWRLGWIVINDKKERFGEEIRSGLNSLTQRLIGPNTLIQGALPKILHSTPRHFFDKTINDIHENAMLAYRRLKLVKGLTPIKPAGAFYMMVRIELDRFEQFSSETEFVETLVTEESVFCLPGSCFEYPGFVRIVLCISLEMLETALQRIEEFCDRHFV